MNFDYRNKKYLRKVKILETLEQLVLENNQEVAIQELATAMSLAKGTIYGSFHSKNHLYLELLILNESRLLDLTQRHKHEVKQSVSTYMLYHMEQANRTVLFHAIEERITGQELKLKKKFNELYNIREQRILELKTLISDYLSDNQSMISVRDYLSYVWTVTYGACLLLSSTYYQKSIGDRRNLMNFYIQQALKR